MLKLQSLFVVLLASAVITGCSKETTVLQYMPHMANTPNLKPQRGYDGFGNGSGMLTPPEGAVARGHKPYRIATADEAEKVLQNPLPMTEANIHRGQKIFNNYCITCHGPLGYGNGSIVNPYPIPKSLQSDNMLKWKDGHIFHVATKGQGVMPSYAQQIQPMDRWAVILYIRALQRAEHPTDQDMQELKKQLVSK